MPDVLQTPRLLLRRPVPDDASAIFTNWTSDPEATRFMMWRTHVDVDDTVRYLALLDEWWKGGTAYAWLVTMPPANEAIGLGLIRMAGDDVEIGYAVTRRLWGQGVATEIANALVRQAAACSEKDRIVALLDAENLGSARVLEKVGMTRDPLDPPDSVHPNAGEFPRRCMRYEWPLGVGRSQ